MKRELSEWASLLYLPDNPPIAHVVAFGEPRTLCGVWSSTDEWWGTGDMDEYETARRMDRCPDCTARIP